MGRLRLDLGLGLGTGFGLGMENDMISTYSTSVRTENNTVLCKRVSRPVIGLQIWSCIPDHTHLGAIRV